jgi:competence protein ComEC
MPPATMMAALALLAGAALACSWPVPGGWDRAIAVLLAVAVTIAWGGFLRGRNALSLATAVTAFLWCGILLARQVDRLARDPPLRHALSHHLAQVPGAAVPVWVEGRLRADAEPTEFGATVMLDVAGVRDDATGAWRDAAGGVRLAIGGSLVSGHLAGLTLGRRVRVPVVAHRPQRYRNPGVPDQELALARRRLVLFGSVKSAALVEITALANRVDERAAATRRWARATLAAATRGADAQAAAVVRAILIGDRAGLRDDMQDRLQRAGTFHVIAISGGNIAILAGLLLWILRHLRVRPVPSAVAAGAAVLAYGATVYFCARTLDLGVSPLALLGAAAAFGVLANPLVIFDAGFALTFGATLGILVGVPRLMRPAGSPGHGARWHRLVRSLGALGAATLCAELALLPVGAWAFSRVSFAGLLLNFLAVPLMAVAQAAGLVALAVGSVHDGTARVAGTVAVVAAHGLLESARLADVLPGSGWRVPAPPVAVIAIYYAGWCAALWGGSRFARAAGLAASGGALVWMLAAPAWPPAVGIDGLGRPRGNVPWSAPARVLSVTVLDVGQGDATIVRLPSGSHWLVDAGGIPRSAFDIGSRIVAPAVWALGVRQLASLVITHAHPDHVGGALAAFEAFAPLVVREGVTVLGQPDLEALRRVVARAGTGWQVVRQGQVVRDAEAEVRVVHPGDPEWERREVRNDDSVVLDIRYGRVSVVLPGDIGRAVEASRGPQLEPAPIRVLKAPHHGSANSSSAAWIDAVQPRVAIVSAGAGNRYNHPGRAALERYAARRVPVFRTDRDGAVAVETDGRIVIVRTWSGRVLRLE